MHTTVSTEQDKTSKAAAHSKESVDGNKSALQYPAPVQKKEKPRNETGMPDQLKSGLESLSGIDLSDVSVHYNSPEPAQFLAHSFAQGNEIHLSAGRENDLAHEGWHVVQQKQGRVKPSAQFRGMAINHNKGLEQEADVMGAKAFHTAAVPGQLKTQNSSQPIQRVAQFNWLEWLQEAVNENPAAAITTTLIIGLAGLATYYFMNREEQPPDPNTLGGVARAIGVAPNVLRNQLENGAVGAQAPVTVQQITNVFVNPVPMLGLVPPSIIANLNGGNDDANALIIFNRLNAYAFGYTGVRSSDASGFLEKTGDCLTLARMFITALMAAGIDGSDIDTDNNRMLVEPRAIHGRAGRQGNVDNDAYWFFHDHHWVTLNGQRYDLLFMVAGAPTVYAYAATANYNNVAYDTFAGGRCIIHNAELVARGMGVVLAPNTVGVTRDSVAGIQNYINAHPATQ